MVHQRLLHSIQLQMEILFHGTFYLPGWLAQLLDKKNVFHKIEYFRSIFKLIIWKVISKFFKTWAHKLKTVNEDKMFSKHERHILFHVIWNSIYIHLLFFSFFSDFLHDKVTIITSEIVKYNRTFQLLSIDSQCQITILMCWSSIISSSMTMMPYTGVCFGVCFVTNMAFSCFLEVHPSWVMIC